MARVVIIGAGPMGLAAAYQAVKNGDQVDLVEAAVEAGGMAAHFDFGGLSIEKYYHFVCRADKATFELMCELGIRDMLKWRPTTMGFFFKGKQRRWGDPFALLRLSGVSMLTKLRYGFFAWTCVRCEAWPELENTSAKDWISKWIGKKGFEIFWKPLFDYKFYEHADDVSAAWIWTRIKRIGTSRRSMFQEELGYIEGGSQTLVDALMRQIKLGGGRVHLGAPAERVNVRDGHVSSVTTTKATYPADCVISTIPTPLVSGLIPALPDALKRQYDSILNIGVCCLIFKLARSVSPHFWMNINDPAHEIPGIIEFSNLRPVDGHIVYVPYYMPVDHPRFAWSDEQLLQDAFDCLQRINPALNPEDVLDARVARLQYAQPICEAGFASKLPPVQTPIRGLQVADTCFYYPEDRGISESVRLGQEMANAVAVSTHDRDQMLERPAVAVG